MTKQVNIEALAGWDKLEPKEQTTVRRETEAAHEALSQEGQSKVAVGEHLEAIRGILHPRHMWMDFLTNRFHMSRATAYRYIDEYKRVKKSLPSKVLSIAKARGFKLKASAIKKTPPPTTNNEQDIVHYLEKLERPVVVNPHKEFNSDMLLKECVNFVRSRWSRLPNNQRTKTAFIRSLMGMLQATFGISSHVSWDTIAVPADFQAVRGRPRKAA